MWVFETQNPDDNYDFCKKFREIFPHVKTNFKNWSDFTPDYETRISFRNIEDEAQFILMYNELIDYES